jgi:hypothetical protein
VAKTSRSPDTLVAVPLTLGEAALLHRLLSMNADEINGMARSSSRPESELNEPTVAALARLKERLRDTLGIRPGRSGGPAYEELLDKLRVPAPEDDSGSSG